MSVIHWLNAVGKREWKAEDYSGNNEEGVRKCQNLELGTQCKDLNNGVACPLWLNKD